MIRGSLELSAAAQAGPADIAPGASDPVPAGPVLVDPERVAAARSRMPAGRDIADTADVLGMLSDPGRLKMLVALRDGELCVSDLTAVAGGSPSGVSHALQLLRAHRVVASRREGRRIYYHLDDPHVAELLDLALAHIAHAEPEHPERSGGTG